MAKLSGFVPHQNFIRLTKKVSNDHKATPLQGGASGSHAYGEKKQVLVLVVDMAFRWGWWPPPPTTTTTLWQSWDIDQHEMMMRMRRCNMKKLKYYSWDDDISDRWDDDEMMMRWWWDDDHEMMRRTWWWNWNDIHTTTLVFISPQLFLIFLNCVWIVSVFSELFLNCFIWFYSSMEWCLVVL